MCIRDSDSTAEYVEQLENDFDIEASESDFADDPDRLVSEVEDFLRNHPGRN